MLTAVGSKKRLLLEIVALSGIVAVFMFLRHSFFMEIPLAQICIFSLFVIFLLCFNVKRHLYPNKIVLIGAIVATGAFFIPYISFDKNTVLVSTISGDEIENESREFWSELNKLLFLHGDVRAKRFYSQVNNHKRAQSILEKKSSNGAIVWGDNSWLHVSFGKAERYQVQGFEIAGNVTTFPIPFHPRVDTSKFLAALFAGIKQIDEQGKLTGSAIAELTYAYKRSTLWIAGGHKGLPAMLLGNGFLISAFENNNFQTALLNSAFKFYSEAVVYVNPATAPELFAAVNNNYAVVLYLKAHYESGSKKKKFFLALAKKHWKLAIKTELLLAKEALIPLAVTLAKNNVKQLTLKKKKKVLTKGKRSSKLKRQKKRRKQNVKNVNRG